MRRGPGVALLLVAGTLLAGCTGGGPSGDATAPILVAFGDSVAAGHGLGDARGYPSNPETSYPHVLGQVLEYDVYSMAISGACAATAEADAKAGRNCTRSVIEDQLPAVPVARADLVTLTIGANDIRFSECFRAFILNDVANDPCRGAVFEQHLSVLERHGAATIVAIRERLGADVPILLSTYYNPLPPPSDQLVEACDLWGPAAIARDPHLAAVPHESDTFRRAVLDVQREAWTYGLGVLAGLNGRLRVVANATNVATVHFNVDGHDLCASVRGKAPHETWIFGPDWDDGFDVGPMSGSRFHSRPMPGPCPDTRLDDAGGGSDIGANLGGSLAGYSLRFRTNCLAHPTLEGHRALADQAAAALRVLNAA